MRTPAPVREPFSDGMGRNEKCGYAAETGRNTQNTEQIFIRVFLEDAAARTQIPPRPACPRDEILSGFLCGVHRNGTTAHSTGLQIFVLNAPSCVTKYRTDFVRNVYGAQHVPALAATASVTGRQPTPFSPLPAPPCVTKYRTVFCAGCTEQNTSRPAPDGWCCLSSFSHWPRAGKPRRRQCRRKQPVSPSAGAAPCNRARCFPACRRAARAVVRRRICGQARSAG